MLIFRLALLRLNLDINLITNSALAVNTPRQYKEFLSFDLDDYKLLFFSNEYNVLVLP